MWHNLRLTTRILLTYCLVLLLAAALVAFLVGRTQALSAQIAAVGSSVSADVSVSAALTARLSTTQQAIDRYLLSNQLADLRVAREAIEQLAAEVAQAQQAIGSPQQRRQLAELTTLLADYQASFQALSLLITQQAGIRNDSVEWLTQASASVRIAHDRHARSGVARTPVELGLAEAQTHLDRASSFNGQLLVEHDPQMGARAIAELQLARELLSALRPRLEPESAAFSAKALADIQRLEPLIVRYVALIDEVAQQRGLLLSRQGAALQRQVDTILAAALADLAGSTERLVQQAEQTRSLVGAALLLATLASLAVGAMLARTITKPLKRLVAATEQINQGDYAITADPRDRSELGTLSAAFAQMAATLREQQAEVRRQHGALRERNGELERALADLREANVARDGLARQLQAALAAAEEGNRVKSRFIAHMSHELRSPLTAILGFSELMRRDAAAGRATLSPDQLQRLGLVHQNGEHLLHLINNVLDLSKLDADHVRLHDEGFDLVRLLAELEETFALKAEQKGLALHLRLAAGVPRFVRGDQVRLRQVLTNLVSNGVKFTARGSVTLQAMLAALADGRATVRFEVTDTGPGIADADLPQLFAPFVQGDAGQRSREGTGLGLPISSQLVRLMGGDLAVRTAVGQGTTFTFAVPLAVVAEAEVAPSTPPRRVVGVAGGPPEQRILVVDDSLANRMLLRGLLEPLGFQIFEAGDGHEALQLCAEWRPHLIWMDLRMPGMDGYETTRRIRAAPHGREPVVVALSASSPAEVWPALQAAGCDDFLAKPFDEDELLELMGRHLGISYCYAGDERPGHGDDPAAPDWIRAALGALPVELLARLEHAAARANMREVDELIAQVRQADPRLAQSLERLAADFEYARVAALARAATLSPEAP